ncbi:MAG: LysR family transcriptional regulator [Myxococcales bacterium]|nr:MAG: LysR family transcriptional regulator [Myxococcales bacterium]
MAVPDLNAVSAFSKVVELKSFRAAAAALGIPKSTVSRKVAELEDALGARLLERTTRSLRLTDAGRAYHVRIAPALDSLLEAERAVEEQNEKPSGRLRLTMTIDGGQTLLGPVLSEYLRAFPDVKLEVELTDRRVDLVEEGFDLAVRAGALADSTLIAKKLGAPGSKGLYASPEYLRRRGTPRHPRELVEHDCLIMSAQLAPASWSFRDKRKAISVEVRVLAQANSFLLLRDLAVSGHGVARLPDYLAAPAVRRGKLIGLLGAFLPEPTSWHVLYPSARNLSPKVRALVELLERSFARKA